MITDRKAPNALSSKTARACDCCARKRARWFCTADDAFLCQGCDDSVHSANQLASRHERVRLETASFKIRGSSNDAVSAPVWHQGFTRKARTPRSNSNKSLLANRQLKDEERALIFNPLPLVPETGSEEEGNCAFAEEDDDQLLYRVPVFDPFAAELCTEDIVACGEGTEIVLENEEGNIVFDGNYNEHEVTCDDLNNLPEFLSPDMDLAEFASDVENLLVLDDDSQDVNDLNLFDCKKEEDDQKSCFDDQEKVTMKVKDEQEVEAITGYDNFDQTFDITRDLMDWNFNYDLPKITADEVQEEATGQKKEMERTASLLRLNYEAVINAWASQGSPFTSGRRPELNPDDCWPDCLGTCPKDGSGRHTRGGNGARDASVLRYKEKRRTRLFSKKIRYEVRKLNAEKRPRMKGRFVKWTSIMESGFPYINK